MEVLLELEGPKRGKEEALGKAGHLREAEGEVGAQVEGGVEAESSIFLYFTNILCFVKFL